MAIDGEADDPVGGGGDHVGSEASLAMLLVPSDLPGPGWEVSRERTWPTGQLDPESEKSRRAVRAGAITAWRSFEQAGVDRSAWFEAVPYATAADASLSLRQAPRYFEGTDDPGERVVVQRFVEDRVLPGLADAWIFEKSLSGPSGDRLSRFVAGTVGQVLSIASSSGREGTWELDDLVSLALRQAERVRGALGPDLDG
jgi:hypothetical protein